MSEGRTAIIVDPEAGELEKYAALELKDYLERLFGVRASVTASPDAEADTRFVLGIKGRGHIERAAGRTPALSEQGHLVRRVEPDVMVLAGGSPAALCWGVYELVERYGVRYLVHGDVLPEEAGAFELPAVDAVFEPVQRTRVVRVTRDDAIGTDFWGLDEHEAFVRQMFKLRFNAVTLGFPASAPMIAYEVQGIRRRTGALNYGQTMPIDAANIGREHLGGAGSIMPPEFEGAETFEEMHAVFRGFMHRLMQQAKRLDMHTTLWFTTLEFPKEFRPLLQDATTEHIQLGDFTCSERGDPMNANHVELVRTVFEAHLDMYGEADEFGFGLPEFPYFQANFGESWQRLRGEFGLKDIEIEELIVATQEGGLTAGGSDRAVREFKSLVVGLDFYHRFFKETGILLRMSERNVRPAFGMGLNGAYEALRFVDRVLPETTRLIVGEYTTSRTVRKLGWLERVDARRVDPIVIATLQDDNAGWLPLVTTEDLHILLQGVHEFGWDGFILRHWAIGDIDPTVAYLSRASWDVKVTPRMAYADHFKHVYGEKSVEPLCQVMRLLEDATTIIELDLLGVFFPVLGVLKSHIQGKLAGHHAVSDVGATYAECRRKLESLTEIVERASGRLRLAYMKSRMTFSIEALREAALLHQGAEALEAAGEVGSQGDAERMRGHLAKARDFYGRALACGEAAVRAAATEVRDSSDRGGIAAYYHLLVREARGLIDAYVEEVLGGLTG